MSVPKCNIEVIERVTDLTDDIRSWMSVFFTDEFMYACEMFLESFRRQGIKDLVAYYSGGGCCHFFVQDEDNYIHSIHNTDHYFDDDDGLGWQCETSHLQWDSVHDYVDNDDQSGFAYEFMHPNYDDRTYLFNPKTSEFLNT